MSNRDSLISLNLSGVLLVVFIILKLTNNIDWSWWWVLSPLWIPFAFMLCLSLIVIVIGFIAILSKSGSELFNLIKRDRG